MLTELDDEKSKAARDLAIEQVDEAADTDWKLKAEYAILQLHPVNFTTDDVWRSVEKPREARAMGGVLRKLAKEGLIKMTGRYVNTRQVSRHSAPVAVWCFVHP